eukprot:CAMPEP_0117656984 /NCGR_PEP_ID=MMETSP0804-20121206/5092_1 /TAXON_ID=1074897 /ORGANISM="Tetraselmis astigmatica, Strain CCMP880" /LENGTH=635 /DNA_ID=CAMNT_0005463415 /DNA_START=162 /DNA_END=2069 /DNA_ORIENTATION=+
MPQGGCDSGVALLAAAAFLLALAPAAVYADRIRVCTTMFPPHVFFKSDSDTSALADVGKRKELLAELDALYDKEMTLTEFGRLFAGFDVEILFALAVDALDAVGPNSTNTVSVVLHRSFVSSLYEVRLGDCDIGIGAYVKNSNRQECMNCAHTPGMDPTKAISSNICCLSFSRWYSRSGFSVLTKKQSVSVNVFSALMSSLLSDEVLVILGTLTLSLFVSGHLIWLLEREANSEQFPKGYLDGVDDGLWWSVVTMTTVGYGDKAPVTMCGRFLGVIWMFVGLLIFGVFSGLISSTLTSATVTSVLENVDINGISDLKNNPNIQSICVLAGSYVDYLEDNNIDIAINVESSGGIGQCYYDLNTKMVNAVVYDRVGLVEATNQVHLTVNDPMLDLLDMPQIPPLKKIAPGLDISPVLQTSHYAVVFPHDGIYTLPVDQALGRFLVSAAYSQFESPLSLKCIRTSSHPPLLLLCTYNHPNSVKLMVFEAGWTFQDAKLRYFTDQQDPYIRLEVTPTEDVTSGGTDPATVTIISLAAVVSFVYLLVQYGGLWLRKHLAKKEGRDIGPGRGTGFQVSPQGEAPNDEEMLIADPVRNSNCATEASMQELREELRELKGLVFQAIAAKNTRKAGKRQLPPLE